MNVNSHWWKLVYYQKQLDRTDINLERNH